MMFWLIFLMIIVVLVFGLVVFIGPPYLPTTRKQIDSALDMLQLQEGQTLLELGSGDGRVLLAAAKRGWKCVGIEANPILVTLSYLITLKYRDRVRLVWGSYWGPPWPRADAVFTFMLPKYMAKLDQRMEQWRPEKVRLASFAFTIPGKEPVETRDGVYLYEYK